MLRYERSVALISGGAGAFGLAIAKRIIQEGGRVVLADLRAPTTKLEPELDCRPESWKFVELDVTSEESWLKAVEYTESQFGKLNLLVNNAGVVSQEVHAIDELPLVEWRRVFKINVDGVFLGMQAAIRTMKQRKAGAIVNIGSIAGYVGSRDGVAYGASKSTVKNLSKQAALSSARFGYGVRVNTVHPAYVWTPLVAEKLIRIHGSKEAAMKSLTSLIPLGALPEADDIAAAVAFLGSDDARMITGADLVVDGGRLIQ
ncbi:SDR family oxidoreductase [Ochrobactrum sp. Q0168]|uniref:SDR family NAD(P)-dependent oxidoreductase n=1 Tax=Ochrobactrum sp. Q0168 TaxID=2793241 RepID=UPI0018EE4542|nr:SDR family oxidoreductase [Ochrobactrum sp. Q0168]